MAVRCLIACLILVAVSGRNAKNRPHPLYYNHPDIPNDDAETFWDFASHATDNDGEDLPTHNNAPAILNVPGYDSVPLGPGGSEEVQWQFSPLENGNKDYLYDYVSDSWMGEENGPYYYGVGEESGEKEDYKKEKNEKSSKHTRKHRRARSFGTKHKREYGLNRGLGSHPEDSSYKRSPQFLSYKRKRAVSSNIPNLLVNPAKIHKEGDDLPFVLTVRKRDARAETAKVVPPAGSFQMHHVSRISQRRKRQLKAHQLEYFTDNDGDSQFHAPGKAEGTEWDLVPLEEDSEEVLGIQYDKNTKDVPSLLSE